MAPSWTPTRFQSAIEVLLRTKYARVFPPEKYKLEQEAMESTSESAVESLYWIQALRYVEQTSLNMEEWRIVQRYALACIYFATSSVSTPLYQPQPQLVHGEQGPDEPPNNTTTPPVEVTPWKSHRHWAHKANSENECFWEGVICNWEDKTKIDSRGHWYGPVVSIVLSRTTLTGTFPLEVVLIKDSLTTLVLSQNLLSNEGPSNIEFLGQLTKLERLDLSDNAGIVYDKGIPTVLGGLTNLTWLDLSNTNIAGPLDSNAKEIFQSWSNLEWLQLGGLDSLTNASLLFDLVPLFPNLKALGLNDMSFESELSMKLQDLPQLQWLNLRNARLTGGLDTLVQNTNDNHNASLYDTTTHALETLLLDDNPNLGGTIPTQVGQWTNLRYWTLSHCNFTGPIPSNVALMTSLTQVAWNNNTFTGPLLHTIFGALSRLQVLQLQDNDLTGGLTDLFPPLDVLPNATLHNNNNNTNESHDLPSLVYLQLDRNPRLGGSIPPSVARVAPDLVHVGLSQCGLTGHIPTELQGLAFLRVLELQDNTLTGTIPTQLGNLAHLRILSLQHNPNLTGSIPNSLCDSVVQFPHRYWWITADCDTNSTGGGTVTCPLTCCAECY